MVVEECVHYVAGGSGGKDEWWYQHGSGYDGVARLGATTERSRCRSCNTLEVGGDEDEE